MHDSLKPVPAWLNTYSDATQSELFRRWLRLLLDDKRRFDIGEGYGFSPVSTHAGLLTYRYFRLFTRGDSIFKDSRLKHFGGLAGYDHDLNVANDMIKTESLEEDFIRIMSAAGYALSEDEIDSIHRKGAEKTNVSERKSAAFYYDDATIELVADKDRYLIEKYSYAPPI